MTDTRPPVPPVEGHYALLRNGMIARPVLDDWPENPPFFDAYLEIYWWRDGTAQPSTKADLDVRSAPLYDIIATISPEDMQAVASGELARLRAENDKLKAIAADLVDTCSKNVRMNGTTYIPNFIPRFQNAMSKMAEIVIKDRIKKDAAP